MIAHTCHEDVIVLYPVHDKDEAQEERDTFNNHENIKKEADKLRCNQVFSCKIIRE